MREDREIIPSLINAAAAPTSALSVEVDSEPQSITLLLDLQTADALISVLSTIARLGCSTSKINATAREATVQITAPQRAVRRLAPCLRELIEVLAVVEVHN